MKIDKVGLEYSESIGNRQGAHYTKYQQARDLVCRALQPFAGEFKDLIICDPACGGGAFLVAAVDVLADMIQARVPCSREQAYDSAQDYVIGVDVDQEALNITRECLNDHVGFEGAWDLRCGDFLRRDVVTKEDEVKCFVGNPPFLGGNKISSNMGKEYARWLTKKFGCKGTVDYCAYFLLQSARLSTPMSTMGFICPNSISEGETRRGGLKRLVQDGWQIYDAEVNKPWDGKAKVVTSEVCLLRGGLFPCRYKRW